MRYSVSESDFQTECIKHLKGLDIYHINLHGSAWCGKGCPDIIACINGRFVAFELKVENNDMQPDQRVHQKKITRSGGVHFCPRTLAEFTQIVETLRRIYDEE